MNTMAIEPSAIDNYLDRVHRFVDAVHTLKSRLSAMVSDCGLTMPQEAPRAVNEPAYAMPAAPAQDTMPTAGANMDTDAALSQIDLDAILSSINLNGQALA